MATVRDFQVNNGLEVNLNANIVGSATALDYYGNIAAPTVAPSVVFDFARSTKIDSRLTFARPSVATYRAANGMLATANADIPRFGYNANGTSMGVMVEKGSTNDIPYSTAVGNLNFWSISGGDNSSMAIQLNAIQAPDGSNTASLFYHNSAVATYKTCGFGLTVTSNRIYTHSFFAKNNGEPSLNVVHYDGLDARNTINFTYYFSNNTFGPVGTGGSANCAVLGAPWAEPYANGWVRISYSYHYTNGTTRYVSFKNDLDYSTAVVGRGYYLWGHQHEWNDKPSSFIYTTTSAATRAYEYLYCADDPIRSGNNLTSWLHPSKGTVEVEWNVPFIGPTVNNQIASTYSAYPGPFTFWKSEGDGNNVLAHLFYTDATVSKPIAGESFFNGINQAYYGQGNVANGVTNKTTFAYDYGANNIATSTNGGVPTGGGMANTIPPTGRLDLGRSRANWLDGTIKTFRYWPNKLTNTDIQYTTLV